MRLEPPIQLGLGLEFENKMLLIEARDVRSEKTPLNNENSRLEAKIMSLTRERQSLTSEIRNAKATLASRTVIGLSLNLSFRTYRHTQEQTSSDTTR